MAKKVSKSKVDTINSKIQLVMKSGKYCLGFNQVMGTLRAGRSKLIVISNNCHPVRKAELEYSAFQQTFTSPLVTPPPRALWCRTDLKIWQ
jgi:ribosomal protein L30E